MKKKILLAAALAAGVMAGTAAAAPLAFDPDGPGLDPVVNNVTGLDWAPGNALSIGGNTAVFNFLSGAGPTEFDTVYHASLASLQTTTGPFTPAGLNTAYEITVVAGFREDVVAASFVPGPGLGTATFVGVPGPSWVEIYYDTAVNANDLAGTGFSDGALILKASVDDPSTLSGFTSRQGTITALDTTSNGDQYPGQLSIEGTGSTTLDATVTAADPAWFKNLLAAITLDLGFNGDLKLPYDTVDPSAAFVLSAHPTGTLGTPGTAPTTAGAGAPLHPTLGIGSPNGGLVFPAPPAGPSVQFQADGNSPVDGQALIPEPVTSTLGLMGLAALGLTLRRRRA